ncbi:MAG: gamma-glutamyl-gamma-aminobutyrate hydrolase family protein [Acidobacteriota bacterium]|nr:gamma-glutamyl-gamma-aminobutyrate hydrolase family protein [Acidobacteriota bacterium]
MSENLRVVIPFRYSKKVEPYVAALRAAGAEPVAFLTEGPIEMDGAAGLLLMGGTDVNPIRYGQEPVPETNHPDDERDEIELETINQAIQKDLPILAICRGLQLLNVYHGGTLTQHLGSPRHDVQAEDKGKPAHEVEIERGTVLAQAIGVHLVQVNSRHHQAVATVGAGLQVSARDPRDGIVEGLERADKRFVVAVQWHPEDQILRQPEQLRLFQRFVEEIKS